MAPALHEYGVLTDGSDVGIHVCPKTAEAFVFEMAAAKRLVAQCLREGRTLKPVYVDGELRAQGFLLQPGEIDGCVVFNIPADVLREIPIEHAMRTTAKGRRAAFIAGTLIQNGAIILPGLYRFLQPPRVRMVPESHPLQMKGVDLFAHDQEKMVSVQVKCDLPGGTRAKGGSGNLFMQVSEINPEKSW